MASHIVNDRRFFPAKCQISLIGKCKRFGTLLSDRVLHNANIFEVINSGRNKWIADWSSNSARPMTDIICIRIYVTGVGVIDVELDAHPLAVLNASNIARL